MPIKLKLKEKDFVYYPEITDKDFYAKIYSKKEFHKNIIPKQRKTLEEACNPSSFNLTPYQKFLKNFISIDTPYNGILIYHGTGVGKTCTAVSIAENFKDYVNATGKKIIIITNIPDNIRAGIYNIDKSYIKGAGKGNIVQCTGMAYELGEEDKYLTREQKIKKINNMINKYYKFIGYLGFANEVKRMTHWDGVKKNITPHIAKIISHEYSNRIIIIDEVHNIKSLETGSEIVKNVPPILKAVLTYAKNIKLVMMSATPMYNNPQEIIFLLNLLLLNDKRTLIKPAQIFTPDGHLKEEGIKLLKDKIKGYISYLRGEMPPAFPYRIFNNKSSVPHFEYDIYGQNLDANEKFKYLRLVLCPMSNFQYDFYRETLQGSIDRLNEKKYETNFEHIEEGEKRGFNALQSLTMISNITYFNKDGLPIYGKSAFTRVDDGKGAFYRQFTQDLLSKKRYLTYRYQKHVIFNAGEKKEKPILDQSILAKYSDKFARILEEIRYAKGICFVYSEYNVSGILPLALTLEQNGFERYTIEGEKQLLDYSPNRIGGGGKNPRICYYCGLEYGDKIHNPRSPKHHKFHVAKYILLTGMKDVSKITAQQASIIINNPNNADGMTVKIILGTRVAGEGIDFHRIRQVHVLEPWYNLSKVDQVIGRAVRNCSHKDLPHEKQNVEVFLYAAIPPKDVDKKLRATETIDIKNYRISELKDVKISAVKHVLKEGALDCAFNRNWNIPDKNAPVRMILASGSIINYKPSDQDHSRECDYEKCNYKCDWMPPNEGKRVKIDASTYNIKFAYQDIQDVIQYIKELYRRAYVYKLDDIVQYVLSNNPNIDIIFIYKAIEDLLKNPNEFVFDRYNRIGRLIYKNGYYYFQPNEINDKKLPMYYRMRPLSIKPKYIEITDAMHEKVNETSQGQVDGKTLLNKSIRIIYELSQKLNEFSRKMHIKNFDKYIIEYMLQRLDSISSIILLKEIIKRYNNIDSKYKDLAGSRSKYSVKGNINIHDHNSPTNHKKDDKKNDIKIDKDSKKNKDKNNKDKKDKDKKGDIDGIKQKNIREILQKLLRFYKRNVVYDCEVIKGRKTCDKIVAYNIHNECHQLDGNKWKECVPNILSVIELKKKKEKKLLPENNFMGLLDKTNRGKIVFKIYDKTKEKGAMTRDFKISKRSIVRGRSCDTYNIKDLDGILKYLNIKNINLNDKIGFICMRIELLLRYYNDIKKNNKTWFRNMLTQ